MNQKILNHFLEFSKYTYPGLYKDLVSKNLPDDIREIGLLVRKSIIHRSTLALGNVGTNADLRFGDMTKIPWWVQPEDDILITAAAILAELYHRDERGLILDRASQNKLILTCRFVSILTACVLKSKGVPAIVRSGHASYFQSETGEPSMIAWDHWINQYWDDKQNRFVTIDVDGSLSLGENFDPYDVPSGKFDFPADSWINARSGKINPEKFHNAGGQQGLIVILWALFQDFHSFMNDEILYTYGPACLYGDPERFKNLTETEFKRVDDLAQLMQDPFKNFDALQKIWETEKDFRLLKGGLL